MSIAFINFFFLYVHIYTANSVYMTDMPPPYPGINVPYQGYASGAPPQGAWGGSGQQPAWTPPQQNGAPGWANPNYNNQPMSQAGAYPNYGQPTYSSYPQNPPPYTQYPQSNTTYQQSGYYPQQNPYNPYWSNYQTVRYDNTRVSYACLYYIFHLRDAYLVNLNTFGINQFFESSSNFKVDRAISW